MQVRYENVRILAQNRKILYHSKGYNVNDNDHFVFSITDFYTHEIAATVCDETNGWITTKISNKDASIDYHQFANVSKTWCVKIMGVSEGKYDDCVSEGANRITFGLNRHDFAAAFIEILSQNVGA